MKYNLKKYDVKTSHYRQYHFNFTRVSVSSALLPVLTLNVTLEQVHLNLKFVYYDMTSETYTNY